MRVKKYLYSWLYYSLSEAIYKQCMERMLSDNLISLCQSALTVFILAAISSIFPIAMDSDPATAGLFITIAVVAALIYFIAGRKHRRKETVSKNFIYALIIVYYINIMVLGLYLGVFSHPGNYAVMFIGFIITAPLLFVVSPVFKLCLSTCALIAFIVLALLFKDPAYSVDDVINASAAYIIGLIFGWVIPKYKLLAALRLSELEQQVYHDPLTGVYNRRYLDENLNRVIQSLSRFGGMLSLLMIDIDYFKKYNDAYGHDAGDNCLKTVAAILRKNINRPDDFVARYGGEEFTVVLPNTDENGARAIAEKMLRDIRSSNIPHKKSDISKYVTFSVGITTGTPQHDQHDLDYIKRADEMLYKSKKSGRDRYSFQRL